MVSRILGLGKGRSGQLWLMERLLRFLGGTMLKYMKAHTHLKPGQKGTRRLEERFGDFLLCVRYRYDEIRGIRLKTAEIIIEERPGREAPRLRERLGDVVD